MYFYIDESGNTGLNLFDADQPFLYYGVLTTKANLDVVARNAVMQCRMRLGVDRLHAAELGNARLVEIAPTIVKLTKKYDLRFDLHRLVKPDHALISFFDQTFDQGLNPALPWAAYWTPLRYVLLIKLAYLFDLELLKKAWLARTTANDSKSNGLLIEVCQEVIARVGNLPDARSRELITDGLSWVINNPSKIGFNVDGKKSSLQISPNIIGFQSVMHGIAARLKKTGRKACGIVVDQQSEFNEAQKFVADFYSQRSHLSLMETGFGLPAMDLQNMPNISITCLPGNECIGLELVDIYIWIFKRNMENKVLAPELLEIIRMQMQRGRYYEISLDAISKRWGKWFDELHKASSDQMIVAKELYEREERRRKSNI